MKATKYYQNRVETAIEFIADTLANGETPNLERCSRVAGLSKYHFHRVFKLVTGETLQQTVSRIKLSIAAHQLAKERISITEAAMNAGFESSQSLAKALKREVSVTATQLKNEPDRLTQAIAFFSLPNPEKTAVGLIALELTSLDPFQYIAIPTKGAYPELNQVYHQLFNSVGDPNEVRAILGIPDCNAGQLNGPGALFDCGLLLENGWTPKDKSIVDKQFSGGQFIRVRHNGAFEGLDETLDEAYRNILTQELVSLADSQCLFHYLDDPEEVIAQNLRTDIYIPIQLLN
ncbi:AraC family transcriptional regulator [Aliikangiella marina]|uniref:AraC family transcriptional regulator n=1 Tax=Aliikangiella marina TaxID=1712262 RepID=A0A545T1K2_9GAMM|nr:AraC family transcriptional regulator [Aliikangiella marina]TQV71107.1 AraC family transcriptional regulator [Aliikangiella marina]